jgi:hypothetical protein
VSTMATGSEHAREAVPGQCRTTHCCTK